MKLGLKGNLVSFIAGEYASGLAFFQRSKSGQHILTPVIPCSINDAWEKKCFGKGFSKRKSELTHTGG
jgi:hypothetical protein